MKKLLKTTALTLLLTGTITLFSTGKVKAALQSNTKTQYTKTGDISIWLTEFRKMESETLGLSETFDATTLVANISNNIDSHMMKSTEYGAIAILSASGYGNQNNDNAIKTTTGNDTGMMLNTSKWEWVAGGISTGPAFQNINARYFDEYPTTYSPTAAKRGDGLGKATDENPGTRGWHRASKSDWVNSSNYAFARGNGGIFSFDYYGDSNGNFCARGVVVCGKGL